ncbi:hypothetical protein GCM10009654_20140 [Streptomyces hebeiensis]|uniref:Uncharacterized protein n=1 Tax=Streptomyces hebeiensis TaxID=229486 RepID=A0ABN1UT17_9ACTN
MPLTTDGPTEQAVTADLERLPLETHRVVIAAATDGVATFSDVGAIEITATRGIGAAPTARATLDAATAGLRRGKARHRGSHPRPGRRGSGHGIKANAIAPYADTVALQAMLRPHVSERNRAAGMVPEAVAPVVAWLAHADCTISGKLLDASAGSMSEAFLSRTTATGPDPDLSIETVPAAPARALDRSTGSPYPDGGEYDEVRQGE